MSLSFVGAVPPNPQDVAVDPLTGLWVALDMRGITLRLDGERFIANPGNALDPETRQMLVDAKPQVMELLALDPAERRERLIAAYESVLWSIGREWQQAREMIPRPPGATAIEQGMVMTMQRYAALWDGAA